MSALLFPMPMYGANEVGGLEGLVEDADDIGDTHVTDLDDI